MNTKNQTELDNCQICLGSRGGVRGNENRVDGLVVCDYCHSGIMGNVSYPSPPAPRSYELSRAHNAPVWGGEKCPVEDCYYCKVANSDVPPNT